MPFIGLQKSFGTLGYNLSEGSLNVLFPTQYTEKLYP